MDLAPYARRNLQKMYLVSARGGEPKQFQPDFGIYPMPRSVGPIWSPDGRFLMFPGARVGEGTRADWWVAPVDGGPPVPTDAFKSIGRIGAVQLPILWLPEHLLVAAGTTIEGINLYRLSIHSGDWRISGPIEPLTTGPGMKYIASVSKGGQMLLSNYTWLLQLWTLSLDARTGLPAGEARPITHSGLQKLGLSVSRDGSKVAYSVYSGAEEQRLTNIRVFHPLAVEKR